jgi:hypothetical protein
METWGKKPLKGNMRTKPGKRKKREKWTKEKK